MATTCTPITLTAGPVDCLDGDCEELATEDGEPNGIDRCSHVSEVQACEQHSTFSNDEWEYCTHAEPWPCLVAGSTATAAT
ncbi:hypothetical protein [Kitasatospora sp. NPDC057223]|uniref:hypothetical protein n=1 Tax=Kitasatospora sp. NPDC057223 TaxID=3346055 RepID=UPI00362DEDB0